MAFAISIRTEGAEETTRTVDGELLIGRAKECSLSIADQRLSRQHARLYEKGGQLYVQDLGGPNGTTVDDAPIHGVAPLSSGSVVGLGKTRITVVGTGSGRLRRTVHREATGTAPALVKPIADVLAPVLGGMRAAEYFLSLGLGEDTLLSARADTLESILRRTRDFAVLHEVSKAVQSETDGRVMLERVLALILDVTQCERGFAALLDEAGELELEVVHTSRGPSEGRAVVSHTVAEHVLDRGLAVICADAAADERFRDAASILLSETRSLMAVPIVVNGRVLGIIQIDSSHLGRPFDERDLDLLSMVASSVGVALANLRLLERRERTIRELETAQAQLVATQERLVASEQLAAIGRLAAGIAHEVRNHLSPFTLASMIAQKHPEDAQLQEATEMMREAEQHILELVNQVRNFASGSESSRERAPHDLTEVVQAVLRFLRYDSFMRKVRVELESSGRVMVSIDPRSFRQVLINLIRNAAQALPDKGGHIEVRVHADFIDDRARVEVIDNGHGIAPEVAERIFEPFFSTKGEAGMGLGLDISRKIVIDHGGTLSFTSASGQGTTFTVELPLWIDDATDPV